LPRCPRSTPSYTASRSQDIPSHVTYSTAVASAKANAANADLLWQEWQVAHDARWLGLDVYWLNRSLRTETAMTRMVLIMGVTTESGDHSGLRIPSSSADDAAASGPVRNRVQPAAAHRHEHTSDAPVRGGISGLGGPTLQPFATSIIAGASVELPLVLSFVPVIIGPTV
jgi:hypothetical protein